MCHLAFCNDPNLQTARGWRVAHMPHATCCEASRFWRGKGALKFGDRPCVQMVVDYSEKKGETICTLEQVPAPTVKTTVGEPRIRPGKRSLALGSLTRA